MKSHDDILEKIDDLERNIDKELEILGDPIKQFIKVKEYHAMQVALEWVLDEMEGLN